MPKVIFWDNDGVLVDTERLYFDATRESLESVGIALPLATFKALNLHAGRSAFDLARDGGMAEDAVLALRDRRNARFTEILESCRPLIDGVAEVLDQLAERHDMAIVTTSRREHFEAAHRHTGILHHFDFVLTRGDYERSKPEPDPYLAALARADVSPPDAVVIEDSPRGTTAAIAAGLRCIAIPRDLTCDGDFRMATDVVSSIRDLPAALGRLS